MEVLTEMGHINFALIKHILTVAALQFTAYYNTLSINVRQ